MRISKISTTAVLTAALTAGGLPLLGAPAIAASPTWHVVSVAAVKSSLLTKKNIRRIDPHVVRVAHNKGGVGNISHCGLERTEPISLVRHTRWWASVRKGITLVIQLTKRSDAKQLFRDAKVAYLGCTPATFGYSNPLRVEVHSSFKRRHHELRLRWAIYTDKTHTTTRRADGLTIRRAGAALIVTRSRASQIDKVRQDINRRLTGKQKHRYRKVAFY